MHLSHDWNSTYQNRIVINNHSHRMQLSLLKSQDLGK